MLESAITLRIFTIELQLLPVLFSPPTLFTYVELWVINFECFSVSVIPESQWKDKEEKGTELLIINGYYLSPM